MTEKTESKKKPFLTAILISGVVVIVIAAGIGWYFNQPRQSSSLQETDVSPITEPVVVVEVAPSTEQTVTEGTVPLAVDVTESVSKPEPVLPIDTVAKAIGYIDNFFLKLDEKEYMRPVAVGEKSVEYFSAIIQKALDNPPLIAEESDDLFNLLQNTAHFYRIFGSKNIAVSKKIMQGERKDLEQLFAESYLLSQNPQQLQEHYSIKIPAHSLYQYSCFFLNTLGGKLYMFRRDLELRLLVTYYSIRIVAAAEAAGNNSNGIDLRPVVDKAIREFEAYGQSFHYREEYLEQLYALDKKMTR